LVRANGNGEIGFLSDYRRLNVAITRAKKHVFIVGHGDTISADRVLRSLVEYSHESGMVVSAATFVSETDILGGNVEDAKKIISKTINKTEKIVRKSIPAPIVTAPTLLPPTITDDEIQTQLNSLLPGESFSFPSSLSAAARRNVHSECETRGWMHGSSGDAGQRYVWVRCSEPPTNPPEMIKRNPPTPVVHQKPIAQKTAPKPPKKAVQPPAPIDPTKCAHTSCPMSIKLISIECGNCGRNFCVAHRLPEVHGCSACKPVAKKKPPVPPSANPSVLRKKLASKMDQLKEQRGPKAKNS
jgi:hypothetical protein